MHEKLILFMYATRYRIPVLLHELCMYSAVCNAVYSQERKSLTEPTLRLLWL